MANVNNVGIVFNPHIKTVLMIFMYKNIFESSVILSGIAFAFGMYPNFCISLIESMEDFKLFERDMEEIRISSL